MSNSNEGIAQRVLDIAKDEAPDLDFYEATCEAWEDGERVSVFLVDADEDEVEVVVPIQATAGNIVELFWKAVEGRSAAAASLVMEREAERKQMGITD